MFKYSREKFLSMSSNKLSRDLWLLIIFGALRTVSDLFMGAFFISFVMHISVNEIVSISTYKLFEYVATCAGFFLFAGWVKRHNKATVFGLSVLPKMAVLSAIIFLGADAVNYVVPLGLLYGLSAAMYYLPRHVITADKVSGKSMGHFVGTNNAIGYLAKILAPVILGCFIDTGSYTDVAFALLLLSCVEFGLSFMLTPSRHRDSRGTDFIGFYRCMRRFPVVRKLFLSEVLRGFGLGLLGTVITMYTVYIFHSDLNLGILTTVFAICSVLTCWVFRYISRDKTIRILLQICVFLVLLSMLFFVWRATPVTFLIYNLVYATAIIFIEQSSNISMYKLSRSRCVTRDTCIEYFVLRDFALFLGRWVGFVGLIYVGVYGGYDWLRYYLILIGCVLVLWGWVCRTLFIPRQNSKNRHS